MKKIHFAAFLTHGANSNGTITWKHPRTRVGFEWNRPEIFEEIASICERGKFDMLFFADQLAVNDVYGGSMDSYLKNSVAVPYHDPISLVSLLAGKTKHIGLGCTMSTSYYPPYLAARILATMDHLSRGRIAWNVVTSFNPAEAKNFGLDKPISHDERYERAEEYMDLVYQLWDAWEPDAVIEDRENGIMIDPSKVRHINFSGKYFKCRGPLNVARSPQGRPVIAQAGASTRGIAFAAKHAEVIFALKSTVDDMKKFYDEVKNQMVKFGRKPEECKILFGVQPIVGETEEIALIKEKQILELASVEAGLTWISGSLGTDLSGYDFDQPIAEIDSDALQSKLKQFSMKDNPTLRDICRQQATGATLRMVGSGEQVAEQMEDIMKQVGGDGFMILPTYWPSSFTELVEMVVPILQKKGIYRTEYEGETLKENVFGKK